YALQNAPALVTIDTGCGTYNTSSPNVTSMEDTTLPSYSSGAANIPSDASSSLPTSDGHAASKMEVSSNTSTALANSGPFALPINRGHVKIHKRSHGNITF